MKKLFLLLATSTVLLTSCTSNDPIEKEIVKPKIYAERIPGGVIASLPDSWEIEISGNNLASIKINENSKDQLLYSANKLVRVNHFLNSNSTGFDELTYDGSGRLISVTNKDSNNITANIRTYDYSNPNLIAEEISYYNTSGTLLSTYTRSIKIENGNILEFREQNDSQINNYVYDTNKNVFSDLNNLNDLVLYYYASHKINKNNRVSLSSTFYYNGSLTNTTSETYINEYDQNNKITKAMVKINGVDHYRVNHTY